MKSLLSIALVCIAITAGGDSGPFVPGAEVEIATRRNGETDVTLRAKFDSRKEAQAKVIEYIEAGATTAMFSDHSYAHFVRYYAIGKWEETSIDEVKARLGLTNRCECKPITLTPEQIDWLYNGGKPAVIRCGCFTEGGDQ